MLKLQLKNAMEEIRALKEENLSLKQTGNSVVRKAEISQKVTEQIAESKS